MAIQTETKPPARLVIRTADQSFRCVGSRPTVGYQTYIEHWGALTSFIRRKPIVNPNFSPVCVGIVQPGDRYVADADSESRYCLRCGTTQAASV